MIGGGKGAAWKAELLSATGAAVFVFAPSPSAEMEASARVCPSIALHRRPPVAADWADTALAVAEADGDEAAASVWALAAAHRVPLNVIDRPEFCDFTFGTLVQRGPVVIGISTDGAAPVLAQAIRRRIEAILPRSLGAWVEAAKRSRAMVARLLPSSASRRAFWERFVDLAFASGPAVRAEDALAEAASSVAAGDFGGRVTLVGAGPGDPELLTMKAMRALQQADVILHDDLVSDEVLMLARREARRVLVGKRGGRPSCRQAHITAKLIGLAREGLHVVRLKSGDPLIFGRAGEEIAALREAGIPVEVVPGITAAAGAAARLGVSLTHRDLAHSVRFITGHGVDGQLPDLDWQGIADPATTLLVYMGGRTAGSLARRLLARGLPPNTPVAIVENATRADEAVRSTSLIGLAASPLEIAAPVLLGIGKVFGIEAPSRPPAAANAEPALAAL